MTTSSCHLLLVPTIFAGLMTVAAVPISCARADAANYKNTLNSTTWVITKGAEGTSSGTGVLVDALWVDTSGTVRTVYLKKFRTGAGEHEFTVVETQSPINSGDSGGPVVNDDGRLVRSPSRSRRRPALSATASTSAT